MRERRIGLAVIVALLLALSWQHAPRISVSASAPAGQDAVEMQAAIDLGSKAGALLFTWTIDHLEHAR